MQNSIAKVNNMDELRAKIQDVTHLQSFYDTQRLYNQNMVRWTKPSILGAMKNNRQILRLAMAYISHEILLETGQKNTLWPLLVQYTQRCIAEVVIPDNLYNYNRKSKGAKPGSPESAWVRYFPLFVNNDMINWISFVKKLKYYLFWWNQIRAEFICAATAH